jgi:hypothetical protein
MSHYRSAFLFLLIIIPSVGEEVVVEQAGPNSNLRMQNGEPFHTTDAEVTDARAVSFPQSPTLVVLWNERDAADNVVPYYAISFDGTIFPIVRETTYEMEIAPLQVDPITAMPAVPVELSAPTENKLYFVQFVSQPLDEYRAKLAEVGAKVLNYVPHHSYLVEMSDAAKAQLQVLPYVRWIGPYHPAYKIPGEVRDQINAGVAHMPAQHYRIAVQETGLVQKTLVAGRITLLGGAVDVLTPSGFILEATLTGEQLLAVLRYNEVLFVDLWKPIEYDMDTVRKSPPVDAAGTIPGGANHLEQVAGYNGGQCTGGGSTGHCVRAEVADLNIEVGHQDWLPGRAPIVHGSAPSGGAGAVHGIGTFGILFGDGSSDDQLRTRGVLPTGQGVFALAHPTVVNAREQHTCQLAYSGCGDINSPYRAVFQSNSWGTGSGGVGPANYTAVTSELDYIAFTYDVLILHSQGNSGCRCSNEQGWAKNILTVSGLDHRNTLGSLDDRWISSNSGHFGPTWDGRQKPDLVHFYDPTILTSGPSDGTQNFGGTSAAAPITAGHFGLFFQMWADDSDGDGKNIFGMTVPACNPAVENCVFKRRPHITTAKAMMINTAKGYPLNPVQDNLFRERQGWGLADVKRLHDMRRNMFIVDETDLVTLTQSATYTVVPTVNEPMKATLVYADPAAAVSATVHRVNDLSLKVTSPTGTIYWGNNGLIGTDGFGGNDWSSPDGSADDRNTVENVFIQNPQMGVWTVQVIATDLAEDGHKLYLNNDPSTCFGNSGGCVVSSPTDADFALVVSGVATGCRAGAVVAHLKPDTSTTSGGINKSRTLSFENPSAVSGVPAPTAIRVKLIDLENPIPPNNNPAGPCCPPGNFITYDTAVNSVCAGGNNQGYRCATAADCPGSTCPAGVGCTAGGEGNACTRWVGKPLGFLESNDNPGLGNYKATRLQCAPRCQDWSGENLVHLVGAEIVPSSTYEVQVLKCVEGPPGTWNPVETDASCPLTMTTARAGDITTPFQTPAPPPTQPDAMDVTNAVNKFRNQAGAPVKAISQVQPNAPDPNADYNAIDLVTVVDHCRGFGYRESGPCACPSPVACNRHACVGAGDCRVCVGGTTPDAWCDDDHSCPGIGATCGAVGVNAGSSTNAGACVKTCTSGPRLGELCNNNLNCGSCIGGPLTGNGAAGIPCDANPDCASGQCSTGVCGPTTGGFCVRDASPVWPSALTSCTTDTDCTTQHGPNARCTPRFCRDRCARCN